MIQPQNTFCRNKATSRSGSRLIIPELRTSQLAISRCGWRKPLKEQWFFRTMMFLLERWLKILTKSKPNWYTFLIMEFLRVNLDGSENICDGLNPIRKDNAILDDPCSLRSEWSVAHKYSDPEHMKKIFIETIRGDCSDGFKHYLWFIIKVWFDYYTVRYLS